jgi:predicted phosphoribosyltransferase
MAEPTTNNLVTTTINNYHKEFADNVSNSNAITALLKAGDRVRTIDGGKAISCPLSYAEETFAWYSGVDLLSRALKETLSEADYSPANAVASITLSGPDLAKNKGKERILNLLEGKMENAQSTMNNNITKAVYGDGTVAKSFAGLKAFVTDDGLGTVGGISATTWAFWMNQFQSIARATGLQYPALKAGMNALWMKLIRGTEHPDLVVADAEVYSTYESGLQENQRYADARLGALGFETLKYKQAALVFDGAATGLVGGYMLNTKFMKFEIYEGRNFEMLDLPDQSPDMDAITRHLAFMGALTLSNRSKQGRILLTGV